MFLLSDLASGISGEILHVDCGYNVMGSPGRAIEAAKQALKVRGVSPPEARRSNRNRYRCAGQTAHRVGIGLIRRGGRFSSDVRTGTVYAGFWEFPGGKCEPGESPARAAGARMPGGDRPDRCRGPAQADARRTAIPMAWSSCISMMARPNQTPPTPRPSSDF